MSGFEALGVAGVASQLINICFSIKSLIEGAFDAPQMLRSGRTNIQEVEMIADQIKANPALKDDHEVTMILHSMLARSIEVKQLLDELTKRDSGRKYVDRFNQLLKSIDAARKRDRVEYLFSKLEWEKSNLGLKIGIININIQHSQVEGLKEIYSELSRIVNTSTAANVDLTGPIVSIPYARNERFAGRIAALEELEQRVAAKAHRISIFGLGGVGKTNLVLEFAMQVQDGRRGASNTPIFWVSGDTRNKFTDDCKRIVQKLPKSGMNAQRDAKMVLKEWLESSNQSRWLLVVDNVDDEAAFFEKDADGSLVPEALARFLPAASNGTIIFTTRNLKIAAAFQPDLIHLPALTEEDAVQMLRNHLRPQGDEAKAEADMKDLVGELERLPLAIAQAAAYVTSNAMSLGQYLDLLNDEGDDSKTYFLVKDEFEDPTRPVDSVHPVFRTWRISLRQIEANDPTAAEYLFFMSCLARQSISESLLPPTKPKVLREEALGTLKAYSFVDHRPRDKLIDLHPLVHLVTREYIKRNGQLSKWTQKAIERFSEFVPNPATQDIYVFAKLLSHIYDIAQRNQDPDDTLNVGNLYYNAAYAFRLVLEYDKAVNLAKWDWNNKIRKHGADDAVSHLSAINYADMIYPRGRCVEAEEICRQALGGLLKYRDKKHPDVLWARCLLLFLQGYIDMIPKDQADIELGVLLRETKDALGQDCLLASFVLTSAGQLCFMESKYEESAKHFEKALNTYIRHCGAKHGWSIMLRNLITYPLHALGRAEEARKLMQQNLKIWKESMEGQGTAMLLSTGQAEFLFVTRGNKASRRRLLDMAVKDFRELRKSGQPLLGPFVQIVVCLIVEKRYAEAEKLGMLTLAQNEEHYGPFHVNTLTAMAYLAYVYNEGQKYELAIFHAKNVMQSVQDAGSSSSSTNDLYSFSARILYKAYERSGKQVESARLADKMLKELGGDGF